MHFTLFDLATPPLLNELLLKESSVRRDDLFYKLHRDQYEILFRNMQQRGIHYDVRHSAGTTRGLSWGLASVLDNLIYAYRGTNITPYADPLSLELSKHLSKSALLRMPFVALCNRERPFVLSSHPSSDELQEAADYVEALLSQGKGAYFKRDDTVKGEGVVRISRSRTFLRAQNYKEERTYSFNSEQSYRSALIDLITDCHVFTIPKKNLPKSLGSACLQAEFDAAALKFLKTSRWEIRIIVDDKGLVLAYGKVGVPGSPIANISQGAEPYTVAQLREFSGRCKAFDEFFRRSIAVSARIHRDIGYLLDSIALRNLNEAHFSLGGHFRRPLSANFTVVDCAAVWNRENYTLEPRIIEIQRQAGFSKATQQLDLDISGAVCRVEENLKGHIARLPFSSTYRNHNAPRVASRLAIEVSKRMNVN